MAMGNGVTPQRLSVSRVGANRMRLGRRMPEEAKAWGNAQDTLTSGRGCGGDRGEQRERRARPTIRREGAMLRKEEARNRRSQAWTVVVISTQRVPMTRGASL